MVTRRHQGTREGALRGKTVAMGNVMKLLKVFLYDQGLNASVPGWGWGSVADLMSVYFPCCHHFQTNRQTVTQVAPVLRIAGSLGGGDLLLFSCCLRVPRRDCNTQGFRIGIWGDTCLEFEVLGQSPCWKTGPAYRAQQRPGIFKTQGLRR